MLESALEQRVVRGAKSKGVKHVLKLTTKGSTGWPDRLILIPGGKALFLELKAPGKKPRPLQLYRIRELRRLGYDVEWADNYDDAMGHITRSLEAASCPTESSQVPS